MMSFSNYKTIGSVLKQFQVTYTEADFIVETPFKISDYFREDLKIMLKYGVVKNSEFSICENLIFPVLKEVWKQYLHQFVLWGHQFLTYDQDLSGFPEYILAKRSPLGKFVFDKPYLLLVEAKQDKFEEGWAQCLVEMITAQKLKEELKLVVYGIVSNGTEWQFGKLEKEFFTINESFYNIQQLDQLVGAVNYVFKQCDLQLNELVAA